MKSLTIFTLFLSPEATEFLTSCSRILIGRLIVAHLVKELLAFYIIRRFIAVFTKASH